METPSSARRVTRSQTLASLSNTRNSTTSSKKREDPDNGHSKSKPKAANQDRSALIDITNDSPIVGLASGSLETPASSITKRSNRWKRTLGSGEALLRGQVRTLLQRVEEEAVISKFSLQFCGPLHNDFKSSLNSPAGILAPTPANTPQVSAFVTGLESVDTVSKYPIEDQLEISQLISGNFDGKKKGESAQETEGDLITRSLFQDFSGKSDSSSDCSSVVTDQGTEATVKKSALTEDDDASIWSIQVNASTCDEDEEDDEVIADDIEDGDCEEDEGDMLLLDELCEGMNKISVGGDAKGAITRIKGRHIRFEYNSDDELVEEFCAANDDDDDDYGEVLDLKGLPTPKGKHLRFQDDENN
ncbi:hypothetical protein Cgig2_019598 [Carnegiea gigantea]|uniref:Uncharacterized protein n=1 Tax=Carnegiea gigantea TaxID=171969 RepID=A0A9Q1KIV1_9CARY|nr:hypothetical protein Cgig2_019598 [Carnegiea gigantea]